MTAKLLLVCFAVLMLASDGNLLLLETVCFNSGTVRRLIGHWYTLESSISVLNDGILKDVDVTVNIRHSYDADLSISLVHPSGHSVLLFNRAGSDGDNIQNTTFDQQASQLIADGFAPFNGRYQPAECLSSFNGKKGNGVWKLKIVDNEDPDIGFLDNWTVCLKITVPPPPFNVSSSYCVDVACRCFSSGPLNDQFGLEPLESPISVSDYFTFWDVKVTVNLEHSSVEDLGIKLIYERDNDELNYLTLFEGNGGGGDNLQNTVFDQEASQSIESGSAPFIGNYQPVDPFDYLNSEQSAGTWKLEISNFFSDEMGVLKNWEICFVDTDDYDYFYYDYFYYDYFY